MRGLSDDKLRELLGSCSKERIIDFIMEHMVVSGDASLRPALLSLVTPLADVKSLVSEVSRIISRASKSGWGSKDRSRSSPPAVGELGAAVEVLEHLMGRGELVIVEPLLKRLILVAEEGFDQIRGSAGELHGLAQQAVALWGDVWARTEPRDPVLLAKMVHDSLHNNNYGVRDHMIRDFAEALKPEGLHTLRDLLLADHAARVASKSGTDWGRSVPMLHLAEVADALGDVDMYIGVKRQAGLEKNHGLPIARRLLDAGRAAEAMEHLNRADPARSSFPGEKDDCTTLRVKILLALGQVEDARKVLWQEFKLGFTPKTLNKLLGLTPEDEQEAVANDAIAAAEASPNKLAAARFLLDRGCIDRLAAIVDASPEEFEKCFYGFITPMAEALRTDYPSTAWRLYRALLLDILNEKRTIAYHHAADYLNITEELATRAGLGEKQAELREQLRSQHGRKIAFWSRVEHRQEKDGGGS